MILTVLINTYNEEKNIKDVLNSLIEQTYENFSILIVDDGSTDNTISIIKTYKSKLNIEILELSHVGLTKARQIGYNHIKNGYVAVIDADEILDKDYFKSFIETKSKYPELKFYGGRILPYNNGCLSKILTLMDNMSYYKAYNKYESTTNTLIGGNFIIDKLEADKIGGLKSGVLEDTEFSERAVKNGYKLYTNPSSLLYHKYPTSLNKLLKREYKSGYLIKDQKLFTINHLIRFSTIFIFPWIILYPVYIYFTYKYNKKINKELFLVPFIYILLFLYRDIGFIKNKLNLK